MRGSARWFENETNRWVRFGQLDIFFEYQFQQTLFFFKQPLP